MTTEPFAAYTPAESHRKLVRGKIPAIIRESGEEPITYIADGPERGQLFREKLVEEVLEFLEAGSPEEAIDVIQVVRDWVWVEKGISPDELERLRIAKAEDRGDFVEGVVWCGNLPPAPEDGHGEVPDTTTVGSVEQPRT